MTLHLAQYQTNVYGFRSERESKPILIRRELAVAQTNQKSDELNALLPEGVRLSERLARILRGEYAEPEGRVRASWVARLMGEYGFDQEQIALNVAAGAGRNAERSTVFADIVVYRDKKRTEPFIVVETKKPTERAGLLQAASYARNLGAEYHAWSDGTISRFFRTARYIDQSTDVGNIPHWLGASPVATRLSKTQYLPPFRDEPHLRNIVKVCHDRIFFRLGHDPAKAFDELMKILFLKLYDERETPEYYEFMVLAGESEADTARRINAIFQKSIHGRRYQDVFTTRFTEVNPPVIDLDDETITFIVRQFQGYSLVSTSAILEGADVKGTVFEQMVGGTFRGELGGYFTPREVVEFTIKMVDPRRDDVVLDPACGSGGFLIMTLKYVLEEIRRENPNLKDADVYAELRHFAEHSVYGTDLNERMARVSKMNMIMHGDGHAGIYHAHGLDTGYTSTPPLRLGKDVTCVFSNPPFAGRETDPKHLAKFVSTRSEASNPVSTHKSIPFVEHIIALLAEGGRAGLVLPNGIFNSKAFQFAKLRELIWEKCEIRAIIGLPHWVFFHTGCDVQCSLLFLERTDKPRQDYEIFIDWAEAVGYDAAGRKVPDNDFPVILERYKKRNRGNLFLASTLKERGRMDPLYYQPGAHEAAMQISGKSAPLTELLVPCTDIIHRRKDNATKVNYVEVGDTDPETGKIVGWTEYEIGKLPSRAKFIARENMLLIPNHRNSVRSGRSVVLVPAEFDGVVVTSRFIVARTKVPALYLKHVLNLPFVREKMLRLVSGSSSTELKLDQLRDIMVPLPEEGDFDLFIERLEELTTEIDQARAQLLEKVASRDRLVTDLYAGA